MEEDRCSLTVGVVFNKLPKFGGYGPLVLNTDLFDELKLKAIKCLTYTAKPFAFPVFLSIMLAYLSIAVWTPS